MWQSVKVFSCLSTAGDATACIQLLVTTTSTSHNCKDCWKLSWITDLTNDSEKFRDHLVSISGCNFRISAKTITNWWTQSINVTCRLTYAVQSLSALAHSAPRGKNIASYSFSNNCTQNNNRASIINIFSDRAVFRFSLNASAPCLNSSPNWRRNSCREADYKTVKNPWSNS